MDKLVKIQTGILKKLWELNVALKERDKNYFLKSHSGKATAISQSLVC